MCAVGAVSVLLCVDLEINWRLHPPDVTNENMHTGPCQCVLVRYGIFSLSSPFSALGPYFYVRCNAAMLQANTGENIHRGARVGRRWPRKRWRIRNMHVKSSMLFHSRLLCVCPCRRGRLAACFSVLHKDFKKCSGFTALHAGCLTSRTKRRQHSSCYRSASVRVVMVGAQKSRYLWSPENGQPPQNTLFGPRVWDWECGGMISLASL